MSWVSLGAAPSPAADYEAARARRIAMTQPAQRGGPAMLPPAEPFPKLLGWGVAAVGVAAFMGAFALLFGNNDRG
jgi:hypothetical protein